MSDLSDEEDLNGSPGGPPGKRANHNQLERRRRQYQKDRLADLRDAIPALRGEKPSTVLILAKAREYIAHLTKRTEENDAEINLLRSKAGLAPKAPEKLASLALAAGAVAAASATSSPATHPTTVTRSPNGGAVTIKHEDYDALQQEHAELKAKLEAVEKQAKTNQTKAARAVAAAASAAAAAAAAAASIAPAAVAASPPASSVPAKARSASSPIASSFPHSPPGAESLAVIAEVARRIESAGGSIDPVLASMEPASKFRKRKSRADNDFEKAKLEFNRRRNSTVEMLREEHEEQRSSAVDLLQNFAVQARRASIPSLWTDAPFILGDVKGGVDDHLDKDSAS